jgi:chorismate mutase
MTETLDSGLARSTRRAALGERELNAGDVDLDLTAALSASEAIAHIDKLRERIDEIDAELASTLELRIAVSREIQRLRISHGGRRREYSRELKVVAAYVERLGSPGSKLASAVLELCRGRA